VALKITEIFFSIQGESNTTGHPTVFVRLTGCPMRCTYCDTAYAFHGGERRELDDILADVAQYEARYVTVTGGEPLAQPACLTLLSSLCDRGYRVSLETGNAVDIEPVDPRVYIVLDIKTPASSEEANNKYSNLNHLKPSDAIKFVICSRADYEWAREMVKEKKLADLCEVLFSPSANELSATDLADWILADRLPVRFQTQLHKILWGNEAGR
jgi:7-carboxy-7-deazaguanine synthase